MKNETGERNEYEICLWQTALGHKGKGVGKLLFAYKWAGRFFQRVNDRL